MIYHEWQTMFDEFIKQNKSLRRESLEKLLMMEIKNISSSAFKMESNRTKRLMRLNLEYNWVKSGKPYYKIHPMMVRKLSKINLDKIPAEFIEVPEFDSVCFRFAEDIPTRYIDAHAGITAIRDESINVSPIYVRSAIFSRIKSGDSKYQSAIDFVKKSIKSSDKQMAFLNDDNFILVLDEGFRGKEEHVDRTLCNSIIVSVHQGEMISQAIERTISEDAIVSKLPTNLKSRLENLFRVIISIGFMANAPEDNLIVPDIISRDKENYDNAVKKNDVERIKTIIKRSQDRGHNGWNVGTNEIFVDEMPKGQYSGSGDGKELQYSHIRGGHPHTVRFGEGKKRVKIKWFRPTRVRSDLPFKQE